MIRNKFLILAGVYVQPITTVTNPLKRTTFSNILDCGKPLNVISIVINQSTHQPITTNVIQGIQSDPNGFVLTPRGWVKFWIVDVSVLIGRGGQWQSGVCVCVCVCVSVLLRRWGFFVLFCLVWFIVTVRVYIVIFHLTFFFILAFVFFAFVYSCRDCVCRFILFFFCSSHMLCFAAYVFIFILFLFL